MNLAFLGIFWMDKEKYFLTHRLLTNQGDKVLFFSPNPTATMIIGQQFLIYANLDSSNLTFEIYLL